MIALKKLYGDELLRLALVLSLLKADPNDYLERETQQLLAGLNISNGSDWSYEQEARTLIRPRFVHPKSLDNILINYERQLFEELNSLGRYASSFTENNERIYSQSVHTYLVNNVATDTVAPVLASATVPDQAENDAVSADDNVAQEVKVTEEEQNDERQADAVVTLSTDFLANHTNSDIFSEIASRSFDVNEFLVQPDMQIKKETDDEVDVVQVKKENDDLYSDNAIDFVPYFATKSEKYDLGDADSVYQQNMADLQDYGELFDDMKDLRNDIDYLNSKQQNLEQFLLENTPLDADNMFEDVVLDVKRERASTSFTSASSSGVSDMDVSGPEMQDVKSESDEGHHSGDELTQEVSCMFFFK